MYKLLNYIKYSGIFTIIELFITFIVSIFNLMGLERGISGIFLLVANIILFLVISFLNASKKAKNGYIEGLIISILFVFIMFLLKIIFYKFEFSISTLIYYAILVMVGVIGGMIGINKKSKK